MSRSQSFVSRSRLVAFVTVGGLSVAACALLVAACALLVAACGDDAASETVDGPDAETAGEPTDAAGSVTLLTHDSFAVSDEVFATFTDETGIEVELLTGGDTGTMVSESILTAGNPLADVMFGIDSTFLQRGLDAELFETYESDALAGVDPEFVLDDEHRVTPIDYGDVCVNYWTDELPGDPPETLADLTDPAFRGELVVENPETSSPGLAFLLATIAGTDDWETYWSELAANDVAVTAGWEDAYYGDFVAGGGDRSLVVSYASSPAAEVLFADPPVDTAPTGVLLDSCFRQVEFAGILAGTDRPDEAEALVDFMLSPTFQNDVPLSMFVFPVIDSAVLPEEFSAHVSVAEEPLTLSPAEIEANRDEWTSRWVEVVLG